MAFDAGMLACALHELREESLGARVEKVYQPERDEIVLQIRSRSGGRRILINAGANNPRIGFSVEQKENPQNPPMLLQRIFVNPLPRLLVFHFDISEECF